MSHEQQEEMEVTIEQFESIGLDRIIEHHGNIYIVTGKGHYYGEPYIAISEVIIPEKVDLKPFPVPGTEYMLLFSDAKDSLKAF